MSYHKLTYHWGGSIVIWLGQPQDNITIDGEPSPFQYADASCRQGTAIEIVTEYLGRDWYGYDDGDLEDAVRHSELVELEEDT